MASISCPGTAVPLATPVATMPVPQSALLDMFIPGFSVFSDVVHRYLHVDLNIYIPMVLVASGVIFSWRYFSDFFWGAVQSHCMASVDIRTDDELYNYIMAWVAAQKFSRDSRRSIANTNVNSRCWFLRWDRGDDDDDDGTGRRKKKDLAYTPTFGSHYFWYRGRLLVFRRSQNSEHAFLTVSEREEVSLSCFGRNPWILKELLHEARDVYVRKDASKTLIYRGTTKGGSSEPTWQRCMARTSRPFSTVILNEKTKRDLIDDVTDYLDPATRRWYSNRGIPYRRGYLLHGPPGTGKSSLSLALAGFFGMRIYIVSLSSVTANEENLSSLFAELPRRCVVLLEDIDTAGLTHTREGQDLPAVDVDQTSTTTKKKKRGKTGDASANANNNTTPLGRLSLSGLLNILDGVASQEGRVLIMTTNHIEKLDKALIRPGRVDMIVSFGRSDRDMTAAIFRAIYAPLEGDEVPVAAADAAPVKESRMPALFGGLLRWSSSTAAADAERKEEEKKAAEIKKREDAEREAREKRESAARVERLAGEFAERIPAHEFSPAEIQGYLLKNKRDPEAAVGGAEAWVVEARREKKEKELREAEEKRKAEEEEAKAKEEEEKEKKEKKKGKKGKGKEKGKKSQKSGSDESDEDSDSGSSSEESEEEKEKEKEKEKEATSKAKKAKVTVEVNGQPAEVDSSEDAAAGTEEPTQTVASEPPKETGAAGSEDKLLAEEKKHGGDSGYGTP